MCVGTQSLLKVGGTGANIGKSTQGVLNPLTAPCRMRRGSIVCVCVCEREREKEERCHQDDNEGP